SNILKYGSYKSIDLGSSVFGFIREYEADKLTILLNFTNKEIILSNDAIKGQIILSTYLDDKALITKLRSNEGILIKE
ncbi:MAG TPA: hypothetical protein VMR76_02395, partial [Candidatus Saccharimonadia bacterium]|nr:hypothetical protein [Candidatus Saccharimonadia bacterium]